MKTLENVTTFLESRGFVKLKNGGSYRFGKQLYESVDWQPHTIVYCLIYFQPKTLWFKIHLGFNGHFDYNNIDETCDPVFEGRIKNPSTFDHISSFIGIISEDTFKSLVPLDSKYFNE